MRASSSGWSGTLAPLPSAPPLASPRPHLGRTSAAPRPRGARPPLARVSHARGSACRYADALFVSETYTLEVPSSSELKAAHKDFTVTSEGQVVPIKLERKAGRVAVHLSPADGTLPLPPSVALHIKHAALDLRVMPPFPVGSDTSELYGDETLLVGQTYEVTAAASDSALLPSSTSFTVAPEEVKHVHLTIERATKPVTLLFRAQPPATQQPGGRGATPSWSSSLELPEGLVYEVRHKATDQVVATGATRRRDVAPRVAIESGTLYIGETYQLRVLGGFGIIGCMCEFYVRSGADAQEVTLLVPRATAGLSVAFKALEAGSSHWAAGLPLPRKIDFRVVHKASGAVMYEGNSGPTNRASLPTDTLLTGEAYILQSLASRDVLASRCEFVVTGSGSASGATSAALPSTPSAAGRRSPPGSPHGGRSGGVSFGTDAQEVVLAVDRAVGDVQLVLRSGDGRALPVGVPFTVSHAGLGCVVIDGRTSLTGNEVECDSWYVNQGALYVGEQYTFAVPTGNGFTATSKSFVVGERTERKGGGRGKAAHDDGRPTRVELELAREFASASVELLSDKAGTGHWAEALPLPPQLTVYARLATDGRHVVGTKVIELPERPTQAHVNLTPDVPIVAHQRYTLEVLQSTATLRSTAELVVGSSSSTASTSLRVGRACVPAIVVVLRAANDAVSLPAGLRVVVSHTSLACVVAEAVTDEADVSVRCLLHVPEAFYVGEHYTATVESNYGVGGGIAPFEVVEGMNEPIELLLSRAASEVGGRVFPLLPAQDHWSKALTLPPQQLEIVEGHRVLASTSLAWARGATDLHCPLSRLTPIYVGHTYVVRVLESPSVQALSMQLVAEEAAMTLDLPLRRRSFAATVVLSSKQELPLPYGIKVQIRHKETRALVAAGKAGEPEAARGEAEEGAAHGEAERSGAAGRTRSQQQAEAAMRKVATFLESNDIYFNGAGEAGLPSVGQAWSVNHLDRRYKAQNWKTIDGIAAILREYDAVALEVHGETGPADHAPPALASHFGLDRTRDVGRLMDRLAELRAESCREALILRGVRADRLFVTFKGRGGHIRTDFIPRSLHDSSSLATSVTQMLRPQSAAGAVVFHSPGERQLAAVSQAWTLEHTDDAVRMQNRAALEAVAALMLRYPMLHLEVTVYVQTQYGGGAPRRLLEHFPDGGAAQPGADDHGASGPTPDEVRAVFNRYDRDRSSDLDASELRGALTSMGLVTDSDDKAAAILAKYDANVSGRLEFDEFERLVNELRAFQQQAGRRATNADGSAANRKAAETDAVANVFARYDADRSGSIDAKELRTALEGMGLATSSAQAADVLARYDADRSGQLELPEFRTLVTRLRQFQGQAATAATGSTAGAGSGAAVVVGPAAGAARDQHAAYEQLARARASAILAFLQRLSVPSTHLVASYVVGGAADAVTFTARTDAWRSQAADDEVAAGVTSAVARRDRKVFMGRNQRGATSLVALQRASTASVLLDAPDALYPGERYIVETVPMASLGVPYASLEFVQPERDERLALALDRPRGNVNIVLVDARARSGHWSASLPMPTTAKIRVRHATLGVVVKEQTVHAAGSGRANAAGWETRLLATFQKYDRDRSGGIDASELHKALQELGLSTDGPQAAAILAKYDRDRSGALELDEFTRLIGELQAFRDGSMPKASGAALSASAPAGAGAAGASHGAAVLRHSLRDALYVGETYTLEVVGSEALEETRRDFHVEYVDAQTVEVRVSRKWRDAVALLKYVPDEAEAAPTDVRSEAITIVARHPGTGQEVTSGVSRNGSVELPGAEALYVGLTYQLEVSQRDKHGISARTTELHVTPGSSPQLVELPIGPSAGTIHIRMRDALREMGAALGELRMPPVRFSIYPKPRTGRLKASGTTDSKGRYTLRAGAQLYVGRTYTLEVTRDLNGSLIEAASTDFAVVRGEQTVCLDLVRSTADVTAVFTTVHAHSRHWAAPLKLPAPFAYRIVHPGLGVVAYESEVPRQPSHTVRQKLPSKQTLFVGEGYYLEVGYQMAEHVAEANASIGQALAGRTMAFRGAGEAGIASVEVAWDVECPGGEAAARQTNGVVLDAVATVLAAHPHVHMDVHCEAGQLDYVAPLLAARYKLHREKDAARLLRHLARHRAEACVAALVARGVDHHRLAVTYRAGRGSPGTAFRARAPRHSSLGDPRSGLAPLRIPFTVHAPEVSGGVQEVQVALEKATGDMNVIFRSGHADPSHWSHFLQIPPGLRVQVRHAALGALVTQGVVGRDDNTCHLVGGAPPHQLYGLENYTLELDGGKYFEPDPNLVLLRAGRQDVYMRVTWATRVVRCYLASADAGSWRHKQAAEAYARIQAFMLTHDVYFDGAGEATLPRLEQAWAVDHSDAAKRAANHETLAGIAEILKGYPTLRVEVHGETGAASSAPRQLADYLDLHPIHDVGKIMDELARRRAQACLTALVARGVPASQLSVTAKGRGGRLKVDFIPDGSAAGGGARARAMSVDAARAEMGRAKDELAPLPAGIPYEVRLKGGGSLIAAGLTTDAEPEVYVPLPHKERLVVGQTYVFETFAGPGTEPNRCEFTIEPEEVLERDVLEVRLPVRRVAAGELNVRCVHAAEAGHWSRALALPASIPYHIIDHTGDATASGIASGVKPTPVNTFGLVRGNAYRLRSHPTRLVASSEISKPFTIGSEVASTDGGGGDRTLTLALSRQTAPVTLVITANEAEAEHWSAKLPLPALFDIVVAHRGLQVAISELLVENETGRVCRRHLPRTQLYVGETYSVQIGCSTRVQTERAAARLAALFASKAIAFPGAGEERLRAIEDSWAVEHVLDAERASQNAQLLDEVSSIVKAHPGISLEVLGESGEATIAPLRLAQHYKMRQREDVGVLMGHLARNRAAACVAALVARGVPAARLVVAFRPRSGRLATEFIPRAIDGVGGAGFAPTVADFTVEAEDTRAGPQRVRLSLERLTADLLVRLTNGRSSTDHWSAGLAVASGVPIRIWHKALNLLVLEATVYDGEVLLPGLELFYIHETYVVEVAPTIRTLAATHEVTIYAGTTTVAVPLERPSRRVELSLSSESLSEATRRQTERARERIRAFLLEHDIFFNGAAEDVTAASALGTSQAWSIEHLDPSYRARNMATLDGVAKILNEHPDISLEIKGETTKNRTAEALGAYFGLHPTDDVGKCMDLLARQRGEACFDALVSRGVNPARLWVTSNPMGEAMKVDFIPHAASIPDQHKPLPAGLPFRLLHQRHADTGLARTKRRLRAYAEEHKVCFNGAGESHREVKQAWSIEHTDPKLAARNREALSGLAEIVNDLRAADVWIEVHGETGAADAAPRQLAAYLELNRATQVRQIMDKLAELRAQACVEHLAQLGVPRERLFVTYNGCGRHLRAEFYPRSMRPYAPLAEDEGHVGGADGELSLVHEGVTAAGGSHVICPLPPNAALYVDETYVLQLPPHRLEDEPQLILNDTRIRRVSKGAHFRCVHAYFTVRAETAPEHVYTEHLVVPRVRRGTIKVVASDARLGTGDWTETLRLPAAIPFHIHRRHVPRATADRPLSSDDGAEARALAAPDKSLDVPLVSGVLHPTRPGRSAAVFQADDLDLGLEYEVRVPATGQTLPTSVVFVEHSQATQVEVLLERATRDVRIRWSWPPSAWYAAMRLPDAVPFVLMHARLNREVRRGVLRCAEQRKVKAAHEQVSEALLRVKQLLESQQVAFNSAADTSIPSIAQAWAIDYLGDDAKRRKNAEVRATARPCAVARACARAVVAAEAPRRLAVGLRSPDARCPTPALPCSASPLRSSTRSRRSSSSTPRWPSKCTARRGSWIARRSAWRSTTIAIPSATSPSCAIASRTTAPPRAWTR